MIGVRKGGGNVKLYKKLLTVIEQVIPAVLFGVLVVSVLVGVATRYLFNAPLLWTGQLGTFAFLWMVFLAASGAWRQNMHMAIDLLGQALPSSSQVFHKLFVQLLALVFLLVSIRLSFILATETTKVLQTLNMHYVWVYGAMPVGLGLMALHTLEESVKDIRTIFGRMRSEPKIPVESEPGRGF
jgi:TRAP-type C4-dicarboxylate transport system permease small subunit